MMRQSRYLVTTAVSAKQAEVPTLYPPPPGETPPRRLGRLWLGAAKALVMLNGQGAEPSYQRRQAVAALDRATSGLVIVAPAHERERYRRWQEAFIGHFMQQGPQALFLTLWAAVDVWQGMAVEPWSTLARKLAPLVSLIEDDPDDFDLLRRAEQFGATMRTVADEIWGVSHGAVS